MFLSRVTGRDSCESFDEQGEGLSEQLVARVSREFLLLPFSLLPHNDGFLYLMTTRVVQSPYSNEQQRQCFRE